jgi:hypothetical protein
MAANVLKSDRAVRMSVQVVRAFVKLREMLAGHKELAQKLRELEHRVAKHDDDIEGIVIAIRQLMAPPDPPKRRIACPPFEYPVWQAGVRCRGTKSEVSDFKKNIECEKLREESLQSEISTSEVEKAVHKLEANPWGR